MVIVTHKQAERHTVKTGRETYRQDERWTDRQKRGTVRMGNRTEFERIVQR